MTTPRGAVLVGVANGPDSRLAVRWAAAAAERLAAPLHLVHAMDNAYREIPLTTAGYRQLRRRAERVVADARAALPAGSAARSPSPSPTAPPRRYSCTRRRTRPSPWSVRTAIPSDS